MAAREIVVIGAGPAGVAAAVEAARAGSGVTIVTDEAIGGRATHASLVPSKVLLHLVAQRRARGLTGKVEAADLAIVSEEMERVVRLHAERMEARLSDAGVSVVRGLARFVAADAIEIVREGRDPKRARFDAAVIATGSVPSFPPGFFGDAKGPDGTRIMAPRHLRALRDLPHTMLVVGGGATGAEAVHAFTELGVEVTWLLDDLGILPDFDRELSDSIGDVLMERGVKLVHGKPVVRLTSEGPDGVLAALDGGRTYSAERAFVAIGRRADTARLGLDAIGLVTDPRTGAIPVDAHMRSASPNVLAIGDAAGPPFVASKGGIEGWIAGRTAAGLDAPEAPRGAYVETVYTEPEIAMIGLTAQRARKTRREIDVRTIGFDESVKGLLHGVGAEPHARGVLRVVIDPDSREVLGATAIGPHASEVLGPIAVAIRARMPLEALATSGMASPTFGELAALAGR